MKIIYKTLNERMVFEFEAASHKDAMAKLSQCQELFEEPCCGECKSKAIRFSVREHEGVTYHKMVCDACGSQLDFGQHKVGGTLFARRYDAETKRTLPHRGWKKWVPDKDKE